MRLILAEDSVLLREGLARVLEVEGFEVVAQVGTAEELLARVRELEPDVAIIDIRMPPTQTFEGLRAAQRIRMDHPGVGILLLSQYAESRYVATLMTPDARGVGYLLKDRVTDVAEVTEAIRRVAQGGSVIDPDVVARLVSKPRPDGSLGRLTKRELDILKLMAEGRSNIAIGSRLFLSKKTVETHISSIFSKLDLQPAPDDHRRVLAVLSYLRS